MKFDHFSCYLISFQLLFSMFVLQSSFEWQQALNDSRPQDLHTTIWICCTRNCCTRYWRDGLLLARHSWRSPPKTKWTKVQRIGCVHSREISLELTSGWALPIYRQCEFIVSAGRLLLYGANYFPMMYAVLKGWAHVGKEFTYVKTNDEVDELMRKTTPM